MAQIIKVYTTKPLPESAELIEKGGKWFYPWKRSGKTVLCSVAPCKTKFRIESRKWYAQYRDADGTVKRRPAFTDKRASEKFAEDLEAKAIRRKMGLPGSTQSIFDLELKELIIRFDGYLRSKNNTKHHCNQTIRRIEKIFAGAKISVWGQISPTNVLSWLAEQREVGEIGIKTSNYYLTSVKEFCNWAVADGIVSENPLRGAKPMNSDGDVRRKRRAISSEEFERLILAARTGESIQCVTGEERALLYIVAAWTGFRRGELASLTRSQIKLDDSQPTIVVGAAYSKRRRQDTIPIHPVVADELRRWFEMYPKKDNEIVFSLTSANGYLRATSKMMAIDLASAKVVWIEEANDEEERNRREESDFLAYRSDDIIFADFHANRHTFITNLGKARVLPKLAQSLARHSDIRLTFNVYSHVGMAEQSEAVAMIPGPTPASIAPLVTKPMLKPEESSDKDLGKKTSATPLVDAFRAKQKEARLSRKRESRTDGPISSEKADLGESVADAVGEMTTKGAPKSSVSKHAQADKVRSSQAVAEDDDPNSFALQFALARDGGCHLGAFGDSMSHAEEPSGVVTQTHELSGVGVDCRRITDKKESSPGRGASN
jgi:integrase